MKILIVNADDCNLTAGVSRAILDAHDHGIVTSTSLLVNLPVPHRLVRDLRKRNRLGVGLHLNITLGVPVSKRVRVRSLILKDGAFKKGGEEERSASEIALEFDNQIRLFRRLFGRLPTHLDTHHHLHARPRVFSVLARLARRYRLPIRRSPWIVRAGRGRPLRCPNFLFGSLDAARHWRRPVLEWILRYLPPGVSEIMCHPGAADRELEGISSFHTGRAAEWHLFRSPSLRRLVKAQGITLGHFGLCYNWPP